MAAFTQKFLFKTFNKNISSLQVAPSMQSVIGGMIETLNLHGSILESLNSLHPNTGDSETAALIGGDFTLPPDMSEENEVQRYLFQEIFGQ